MQSEVRKVLEKLRKDGVIWWSFPADIDAAERADAAKREEPVQALRHAVAELVARWSTHYVPIDAAVMVRRLLAELNAIIATKPDTAENRQTDASGPVMHESVWCDGKNVTLEEMIEKAKDVDQWREIKPVIEPAVAEKVYEIATKAVRDAMPDVLDGLAETHKERGWYGMADGIKRYADKLRKERGT